MILNDIRELIRHLLKDKTVKETAKIFGKHREWIYAVEKGSSIKLNQSFIDGLALLGYELQLVRKEDKP